MYLIFHLFQHASQDSSKTMVSHAICKFAISDKKLYAKKEGQNNWESIPEQWSYINSLLKKQGGIERCREGDMINIGPCFAVLTEKRASRSDEELMGNMHPSIVDSQIHEEPKRAPVKPEDLVLLEVVDMDFSEYGGKTPDKNDGKKDGEKAASSGKDEQSGAKGVTHYEQTQKLPAHVFTNTDVIEPPQFKPAKSPVVVSETDSNKATQDNANNNRIVFDYPDGHID